MHIGVGQFEGKEIKDPAGELTTTRSLTVKEEVFTIIGSRVNEGTVLDINDKNGMYGIEALSRGAVVCRFINDNEEEKTLVKENLEIVGAPTDFVVSDSLSGFLTNPIVGEYVSEKYDVIFFSAETKEDLDLLAEVLERQKHSGLTIVVYPNRANIDLPKHPDNSELIETREFEDKRVAIFMKVKV